MREWAERQVKAVAMVLLVMGFLAAAYATALDTRTIEWLLFVPAAVVGITGVLMLKRHTRGAAQDEAVLSGNRAELSESLENVVRELDTIAAMRDLPVDSLRTEIDRRLRSELRRFADARESLVHLFGLQAYADIMSDFAAGERYVNRVWSASADGYGEEAKQYIGFAAERFHAARDRLSAAG